MSCLNTDSVGQLAAVRASDALKFRCNSPSAMGTLGRRVHVEEWRSESDTQFNPITGSTLLQNYFIGSLMMILRSLAFELHRAPNALLHHDIAICHTPPRQSVPFRAVICNGTAEEEFNGPPMPDPILCRDLRPGRDYPRQ